MLYLKIGVGVICTINPWFNGLWEEVVSVKDRTFIKSEWAFTHVENGNRILHKYIVNFVHFIHYMHGWMANGRFYTLKEFMWDLYMHKMVGEIYANIIRCMAFNVGQSHISWGKSMWLVRTIQCMDRFCLLDPKSVELISFKLN